MSSRFAIFGTAAVVVCGGLAYFGVTHWRTSAVASSADGVAQEAGSVPAQTGADAKPSTVSAQVSPIPRPSAALVPIQATEADRHQLAVLEEIIRSKNDNDPRMDTELKKLSPAAKQLMERRYGELPAEGRNERGTIVFLIGRDLSSPDDVTFLGQVLSESPCLSLDDCSKETKSENAHQEDGMNVTLAYPSLVALKSFEDALDRADQGASVPDLDRIKSLIDQAVQSPVPNVADKATQLRSRFRH